MAELTPPQRHGHWCFSRRIDAHGIVKEYSDAHTRAYVRLWWTHHRSWMRKFSEGVLLTEQLQLPKITTVISPGCLVMVAKKKAAISYVIFGETGYSVKHSGWGWPHMLRLHAGSCRCHNISAGGSLGEMGTSCCLEAIILFFFITWTCFSFFCVACC